VTEGDEYVVDANVAARPPPPPPPVKEEPAEKGVWGLEVRTDTPRPLRFPPNPIPDTKGRLDRCCPPAIAPPFATPAPVMLLGELRPISVDDEGELPREEVARAAAAAAAAVVVVIVEALVDNDSGDATAYCEEEKEEEEGKDCDGETYCCCC
jgi:hypothetical protein